MSDLNTAAAILETLIKETSKGYIGMPDALETAVLALAAGQHLLIEDVAGVGKTTLIRCLAKASGMDYGRIQFTPDLLPGDITGMMVWDAGSREFLFREGPLHHQFILADELNRAPARTQSALLEAMEEGCMTVDGQSRRLPEPFFVAATQNPSWYGGTYKLPESQLDRFGISMSPGFPRKQIETRILGEFKDKKADSQVRAVCSADDIKSVRETIQGLHVEAVILDYAVNLADSSRSSGDFQEGLSIRGVQHLIRAAQARAVLDRRDFVIPEDLKKSAPAVLRHRLLPSPEARSRNMTSEKLIAALLAKHPVPVL